MFDRLSADLQEELRRELANDLEIEFLRKSQKEFEQREKRGAADRRARLPEIRRKHKEWVESLMDSNSLRVQYPEKK